MYYTSFEPGSFEEMCPVVRDKFQAVARCFLAKTNSTAFIYGGSPGGKTLGARLLFRHLGITPCFYDGNNIVYTDINVFNRRNINTFFNKNYKVDKKGLVIDNFNLITINQSKKYILDIIEDNATHSNIPMIIVSDGAPGDATFARGTVIPSFCVELDRPERLELLRHIARPMHLPESCVQVVASFSNYNIKIGLNAIHLIHRIMGQPVVPETLDKIYVRPDASVKTSAFDALRRVVDPRASVCDIYAMYSQHKVVLPLILYENVHKLMVLPGASDPGGASLRAALAVVEKISFGDTIESYMYGDQSWQLHNTHAFFTCVLANDVLRSVACDPVAAGLTYSSELNKTSLKNINRKNINNAIAVLAGAAGASFCKSDVMFLSYIVKATLRDGDKASFRRLRATVDAVRDAPPLSAALYARLVEILNKVDKTIPHAPVVFSTGLKKRL